MRTGWPLALSEGGRAPPGYAAGGVTLSLHAWNSGKESARVRELELGLKLAPRRVSQPVQFMNQFLMG